MAPIFLALTLLAACTLAAIAYREIAVDALRAWRGRR